MNPGFSEFLKASPEDRRDVFLGAARRLGTPEQNVEKDFWVTWTLDALFNGLPDGHPRFLFKGGTSDNPRKSRGKTPVSMTWSHFTSAERFPS